MISLSIAITRRCNKSCSFCYLEQRKEDLSLAKIRELLDDVELEHVSITGGEPLMHDALVEIVEWLAQRSPALYLLTNGRLLDQRWLDYLASRKVHIYWSVHEITLEIEKQFSDLHAFGKEVAVHHLLTCQSLPVLRFLDQRSEVVSKVILLYPVNIRDGAPYMAGYDTWTRLVAQAAQALPSLKGKVYYEQAFLPLSSMTEDNHPRCDAREVIFLDSDGRIYPCCLLAGRTKGIRQARSLRCDPSMCPVLSRPVRTPETHMRICPLIIGSIDSYNPISPADLK